MRCLRSIVIFESEGLLLVWSFDLVLSHVQAHIPPPPPPPQKTKKKKK